jgi:proteasome accessory factor C
MSGPGPRPANERLRRVLVMLPWLMERGEVSLAEMSAHFRLTQDQLVRDLELVAMCGLPPFVDELIDVFVDDGVVFTGVPRLFTKPLRLTAQEGFALLATGRAALQLPGADPDGVLASALDKVESALGDSTMSPTLDVELAAPPLGDVLADAAQQGKVCRLQYWTPITDLVSDRRIAPRAVFTDRGHWYVLADDLDRLAEGLDAERTFRIDRIVELATTDEFVEVRAAEPPAEWFGDPRFVHAEIRLAPEATWVTERYPTVSVKPQDDGSVIAVLAVLDEAWLARMLVRIGPAAQVLSPAEWRGLGSETAARLLALYNGA